ncbi:hypothetical protein VPH35_011180 [Triticum aestivum]
MSFHVLPLLLLLHLVARLPASTPAPAVVTHLPGFDGPLPFHLETGYVGVEEETGTELFYYFVESERSPGTDPVILWLTGGPRCSGFCGMVFQVGPINFVVAPYNGSLPQLVYNPYSWSKIASIIFLDTPVGAGFSYAHDPKGYDVGDISSSWQVVTFLDKWFSDHPRYASNPFYIGGTSYAGKVVPLIAQYISQETDPTWCKGGAGHTLRNWPNPQRIYIRKMKKRPSRPVQLALHTRNTPGQSICIYTIIQCTNNFEC